MTVYYVRPDGNNNNTGLGPGPQDAWATPAKALGTAGMAAGDTVYIAPGRYAGEINVRVGDINVETRVIGDTMAEHFPDMTPGPVILTLYNNGDTSAPILGAPLIRADATGGFKDHITWERLILVPGTDTTITALQSKKWTFRDCVIPRRVGGGSQFVVEVVTRVGDPGAVDFLFQRCLFWQHVTPHTIFSLTPRPHAVDYDINVQFRQCVFLYATGNAISFGASGSGSGSGKAYGFRIYSCLFMGGGSALATPGTEQHSSVNPSIVRYSTFATGNNASLSAGAIGMIDEDWNRFLSSSPRSNVTAGPNSLSGPNMAFVPHWGMEHLWGGQPQPFYTPMIGSPMLSFVSGTESVDPTDFLNRPVPAGGKSINFPVGPFGRHNTAELAMDVIRPGAHYAIVGPGDQDVTVLVRDQETTLEVTGRYNSSHGTANKPQAILLPNPEIGVAGQTLTMSVGPNENETLTFAPLTPTKPGKVIVRLTSRAAAANGTAYWADLKPAGS